MKRGTLAGELEYGDELFRKGQRRASVAHFAQLREEHPGEAIVWLRSAFVLDRLGREEEAIPLYERALSLGLQGREARDAMVCLASSLRNVGRTEDGLKHLERARRRHRDDVVVELFSAFLMHDIGRTCEAVDVLVRSLLRESTAPDLERYRRVLRRRFAGAKRRRSRRCTERG
jgi:Flp pilus assembly protein TadD